MKHSLRSTALTLLLSFLCRSTVTIATDWPMLGRDGTRNAASSERNSPTNWECGKTSDDEGKKLIEGMSKNIKWSAPLGTNTHSSPVVSDGLVWIGTNKVVQNANDYDQYQTVLKCFKVADGKEVFEYVSPRRGTRHQDPGWTGLGSSPLIEGDRLWLVTNRNEVICLDIGPLIRSQGAPKEFWKLDLIDRFDTSPHVPLMGPPRPCSIGPSWNGKIFITINNGVGEDHTTVPKPDAPSLVCLNKDTGEVIWTDNSPGANILITQFSSPTVAKVKGQVQVIVPQSDGWLRGFDPETGGKLWEFDINSKENRFALGGRSSRNSFLGNAVVYEDRVYVASGVDAEKGEGVGRLVCIDPTRQGDVSSELAVDALGNILPHRRAQAVDSNVGERAIPNPNSAVVWEFARAGKDFRETMHRTLGSVVAANGLLIVADIAGLVHCLDARTGQRYWNCDLFSAVWASPLIVDDKVYVGDEDGDMAIFRLSHDPNVAMRKVDDEYQSFWNVVHSNSIYSSPVFANGTLYLATKSMLFAIAGQSQEPNAESPTVDWPMLGRDGTRNNVSLEGQAPTSWEIGELHGSQITDTTSRGIRWAAKLGTVTFSSPVVSDGLVWIGTNGNSTSSVLKCFRLADGQLLYEYLSPRMPNRIQDAYWGGLGSSPMIEGDWLWLTTNRGEVLRMDIGPLIRGNGLPKELWKRDIPTEFDVNLHQPLMGPPRPCSIGASWNGRIYITLNNGVDEGRVRIPNPDAPSLVCLDKTTGEVYWKDNSPGSNILLTQLASPTVASIENRVQVIVPQSDGWVRSFDPETGEKLWEFDVNYKTSVHDFSARSDRNSLVGNAVVYENRVYIVSGRDAERAECRARLVCIDPTKRGDVSSELAVDADDKPLPRRRLQAVNVKAGEKVIPNPNSALVWEFSQSGDGKKFADQMHGCLGSVAISKGLLVIADASGLVHCFDARAGMRHWSYETLDGSSWVSPLIVGDKIYVSGQNGTVLIFPLSTEVREPLAEISMGGSIVSTPIFANGTLLVAAGANLFAIAQESPEVSEKEKTVAGGYWPQWRGPNRDNRSSDKGLLPSWPTEGPPLSWRVDGLGDGIASLAIVKGRIFTSTSYGEGEYAVALDESTGKRLWITRIADTVPESSLMRWLSQRTPTVDDNRVYCFTNSGWVVCLDAATGKVEWRISYPEEFGTPRGRWGLCDRPLVDGDKLICTPGGSKATIVALDKHTGKIVWTNLLENQESFAYGAGLLVETDGLKQYVIFLDQGIVSFAVDDGRFLWRYDRVKAPIGNTYTPLIVEGGLLCPNGYGGGIARLKLTRVGNRIEIAEVFYIKISLDAFQDSTVLVDDRLYAFQRGMLPFWINIVDGTYVERKTTTIERRLKAAVTYADGMLYTRWEDGALALLKIDGPETVAVSQFTLPEPRKSLGATFPVVTGRHLYVRDNDRLYCFDVAKHPDNSSLAAPRHVQLTAPNEINATGVPPQERGPQAIYVPTPHDVVAKMLTAANVGKEDVVYDLGSGDGRIVVEAASRYQCRAIGLEIDRDLVAYSREKAKKANVEKLVTIKDEDLFKTDFSDATVVTVYLFPNLLKRLMPQFERLKPGTRIVSHQFEIPDLKPEQTLTVESTETGAKHTIYVWTTPLKK